MRENRFGEITSKYGDLNIALIGDFCLDRYFEIDPKIQTVSIETGRPVHAVTNIRNQPGAAGTILNNLAALGVKTIFALGLTGDDGEGFELRRALERQKGVSLKYFLTAPNRITPTYGKPLLLEKGQPPSELNRLDFGMSAPINPAVEAQLISAANELFSAERLDAVILLEQSDNPGVSVISRRLLDEVQEIAASRPELTIIGDSRRGLRGWPPMIYKMNPAELDLFTGKSVASDDTGWRATLQSIAARIHRSAILTLGRQGMAGATPDGQIHFVPALPTRGDIDIVGAGDCVTANLAAALAAGAGLNEALELANAAASVVIHQIGTTGTAGVKQIEELIAFDCYGNQT